jgi:hypothetical protein
MCDMKKKNRVVQANLDFVLNDLEWVIVPNIRVRRRKMVNVHRKIAERLAIKSQ